MASKSNAACAPGPRCCCGSNDCAFLAHNGRLLEGLERDVSKAAQLGQALLVRHEAYVADSERERRQMVATIDSLERDKLALEAKNAQTIKENRDLLDQLEQLNDAVYESDAQIQALTDTLRSTEEELQRLSSLAARTQLLEKQLLDLEREQALLQSNLDTKTLDERTALQRWKTAERTLGDLQDQIDRIEREARAERERHLEVVARMERRMAVEGELNTATGRLKANAGKDKGGPSVVSHFVKDILLDNANLQHGILELREMLVNSNEEVEHLREQLKAHQPVPSSPTEHPAPTTLQKELENDPLPNQELHIHHHYHAPKLTKSLSKGPIQPSRRPKKKRFSLTPSHFDPFPPQLDRSSTATILSQTAVTVPNSHRWSNATTLAPGSLPSSPISDSHRGSWYDRVFSDAAYDSSRPTSPPDSIDMHSPRLGPVKPNDLSLDPEATPRHRRRRSASLKPNSLLAIRSTSTAISMTGKSGPATAIVSAVSPANSFTNDVFTLSPSPSIHPEPQAAIPEEVEDVSPGPESIASPEGDDLISPMAHTSARTHSHTRLRRHTSHESLISVHGMDIHTLQSRPSQLLVGASSYLGATSVGPELTPWTATAYGTLSRTPTDINRALLAQKCRGEERKNDGNGSSIGRRVGGWVFGKWGATPATPTSGTERPLSVHSQQTMSSQGTVTPMSTTRPLDAAATMTTATSTEGTKKKDKLAIKLRPSGVNQSGPIWGFFDVPETPTRVVVEDYDAEALGEALAES